MTVEKLIKRTIYEAECPACGEKKQVESNPPRASRCACGQWMGDYKEISAIGPDLGLKAYR